MKLFQQGRIVLRYAREHGRKVGLVLVYRTNLGELKVGYSQCHKADQFDRDQGIIQALRRAVPLAEADTVEEVAPRPVASYVADTVEKARKYFRRRANGGQK